MMDAALAREVFTYDAETGELFWKNHPTELHLAGRKAGTKNGRGYLHLRFKWKLHLVHRVAWLMVHGQWPDGMIDHINGNPLDNRIVNLRSASRSQNAANGKSPKSKTGFRGVMEVRPGKFIARIRMNGQCRHVGTFSTAEAAHEAYKIAATKVFGAYSFSNRRTA